MNLLKLLASLVVVAAITGCAHPLNISPDIAKIEQGKTAKPINKSVGYYISSENKEKAVKTPGGGGDSVTYQPYKDIEVAFYKMLSNVFKNVTPLKSPTDVDSISKNSIDYIITPEINTNSSSPSPFTWPPTKFTVDLTCNIADKNGKVIGKTTVSGDGAAEFSEFKSDFSLSGRRATLDSLQKTQDALTRLPELRNP